MYGKRITYCSYILALPKNGSGNKTVRNLMWFLVGTCNLYRQCMMKNLYLCVTIGQKEEVERTSTKPPGETRTMSRLEWFLVFTLILDFNYRQFRNKRPWSMFVYVTFGQEQATAWHRTNNKKKIGLIPSLYFRFYCKCNLETSLRMVNTVCLCVITGQEKVVDATVWPKNAVRNINNEQIDVLFSFDLYFRLSQR